ncbi:MAG: FAD-dependent oxidoreductase [Candidatus Lokiarchaeota archaeon]|nr:FAD-dependent oxidoreductase [Candidatus Lokiarchaeota archaeon]
MSGEKPKVRSKVAVKSNLLPINERIGNFKEVNLGYLKTEEVAEECERCFQCFTKSDPNEKPPPCMKYCPTHCNSREVIKNVMDNNIEYALRIIYEHYPFPRSVERVCPGYCQLYCTAGKKGDSIQIPLIKRFLVDNYGPYKDFFKCEADIGKKVAIIGSGPLGLTAAYYLRKLGISVTIFEKTNIVGGMMAFEIPEFRLPRDILNEEISDLKNLGVEIVLNRAIDEDFTIESLLESGYDAIIIGIGTHKARQTDLPGGNPKVILQGLSFLRNFHMNNQNPNLEGKKVVVIGGGSTATDAARVSKRLGAEVSILYRRKKEQMPAGKGEIQDTEDEGIAISYLIAPVKYVCTEDKIQGAVCQKIELGDPDSSGRPTPIPIDASNFNVEADYIIEAIGQEPDLDGFNTEKLKITDMNTFIVNEKFVTSIPDVLAGGDCVTGSKRVVEAVAHGKIIADQLKSIFSEEKDKS